MPQTAFQLRKDWIAGPQTVASFPVFNKATGALIAHCPDHSLEDVNATVDKASHAFASWKALTGCFLSP